ncbi:hypothetical protein DFAR_1230001 [Desulfarculales bacterium]
MAQWPRLGRGQSASAKREPFPSLSHLPNVAVVLARPPGLQRRGPENTSSHLPFRRLQRFFAMDYMKRGERERLLRDKCAHKCAQRWQSPFSNHIRLSHSTILGWVRPNARATES